MIKGVPLHRDPARHRTTSASSTDSSTRIQAQRISFAPSIGADSSGLSHEVYPLRNFDASQEQKLTYC